MPSDTEYDEALCEQVIPCDECKYYDTETKMCLVMYAEWEEIPEIDKEE